jgi:uncharacterized protein (DUF1697 family)
VKDDKYLALLRGINVGGNNIIRMADLISCFEEMGFKDVSTYIQSGNVIFRSSVKDKTDLTKAIEEKLSGRFNYKSRVAVFSHQQIREVVGEAPPDFGTEAEKYRFDVLFVIEPLTAGELIKKVNPRVEVDRVSAGKSVLYFSRLISKASQSRLSKIITIPEYKNITIRNWNTTTRLLELMDS